MKLPPVLRDKRVQLGVAGAAGLGLIVLVRRGTGAGAGGVADGSGATPQSVAPAVMDSSGTDVYNAIQSLGQGWENDLRDYSSNLASLSTQVKGLGDQVTKLGQTKSPGSTVKPPVKYHTVKITGKGSAASVTAVAQAYGVKSSVLMADAKNAGLKGVKGSAAIGKIVYVPTTLKLKPKK